MVSGSEFLVPEYLKKTVTDLLEESVAKGLECMSVLMDNVVNAAIARKKAKELENQERMIRKTTGGKKAKAEKYVDCRSNDPKEKELFILEGEQNCPNIPLPLYQRGCIA